MNTEQTSKNIFTYTDYIEFLCTIGVALPDLVSGILEQCITIELKETTTI